MEVSKVVLSVFLFLAMAILATLLYFLLLYNPDSTQSEYADTKGNIRNPVQYKGVLWRMTDAVQDGFTMYAYNYCYFPAVHQNDYIDRALGLNAIQGNENVLLKESSNGIVNFEEVANNTPMNLSRSSNYRDDIVKVPESGDPNWYSTGWQ